MIKKILGLILISAFSYAEQVGVASFKYLNNNENSTIIDPSEAQDLLNVDVTPGGKSVKKRSGYGLYKTLGTTQGLHGGFHFFDSSGNDVQVWGSSTSLYGIVADATPTQIVSSATLNSTWDCADTQGSIYCVNSSRNGLIKTNGATLQGWGNTPLGTMIEMTPDRAIVAGVSATPNTLFLSGANTFTNFTVAPLSTDPFTEVIASPGSKITHIRWACGKLLWWKDQSFGTFDFEDQYTASIKIVSDSIGTFDNTSALDPGGSVWFRGQEGHIWKYDCSSLTKETIDITPLVQASGRRTANSYSLTSQSDFQTGTSSPTGGLTTLISAGDVVPSTYGVTENSSSAWSLGTTNNTTVGTSSISITLNNTGTATNPSFETGTEGLNPTGWYSTFIGMGAKTASTASGCTLLPQNGSYFAEIDGFSGGAFSFEVIDLSSAVLASVSISGTANCTYTQNSVTSGSSAGKRVRFRFKMTGGSCSSGCYFATSDSYIFGGSISFYQAIGGTLGTILAVDNIQNGSSTVTSASFTSQALNTGLPNSYVYPAAAWIVNTSTPSFVLQKSATGTGGWVDVATSTGVNVTVNVPYVRYLATFTVSVADTNAFSSLTSVQLTARSSGTFYSAVRNASGLTAWGTFNPTYSNSTGSHNFFIRSSTSPFYVLNSSPPWVAQTPNSLVSASTGTYFQVIDSFTITAATDTAPALNDFTSNWYEGSATDQSYGLYFDNAIWFSVAYGVGISSNTYIFKNDLINDGWTLYNFGAGGMLIQNNRLFFGDVGNTGKIFQYGSGNSDAGTAIQSYWKSKDFTGADPFLENQLQQIDTFAKQNTGATLTATYSLNTSTTTTSFSVPLSSSTQSVIQNRKLLPSGKNGYTFNIKYGDTSDSSAWELFGFRILYLPQPYRPTQ